MCFICPLRGTSRLPVICFPVHPSRIVLSTSHLWLNCCLYQPDAGFYSRAHSTHNEDSSSNVCCDFGRTVPTVENYQENYCRDEHFLVRIISKSKSIHATSLSAHCNGETERGIESYKSMEFVRSHLHRSVSSKCTKGLVKSCGIWRSCKCHVCMTVLIPAKQNTNVFFYKYFQERNNFEVHNRTHTGEKPCNMVFLANRSRITAT